MLSSTPACVACRFESMMMACAMLATKPKRIGISTKPASTRASRLAATKVIPTVTPKMGSQLKNVVLTAKCE